MSKQKDFRQKTIHNNFPHLGDYLPWLDLYEDGTVLTRELKLLCTWKVDLADSLYTPDRWDDINRQVAGWLQNQETGVTYYFDMIRSKANITFTPPDPAIFGEAAAAVEAHRQEIFDDPDSNNVTEWYFSCLVPVEITASGLSDREREKAESIYRNVESFLGAIEAKYHRLESNGGDANEKFDPEYSMLSYLATCISTRKRAVRAQQPLMQNVSDFISTETLDNGLPLKVGNMYVQPMTLRLFPAETLCGMLFEMQMIQFCYRWTTRFITFSNYDGQQVTKKIRTNVKGRSKSMKTLLYETTTQKETNTFETQAVTDTDDVEQALYDQTQGECIGHMTSTILLYGETRSEINEMIQIINERLTVAGFNAIVESRSSCLEAWFATMPGDTKSSLRKPYVTASNIADIIPFSSVYHGYPTNKHMKTICGNGYPHVLGKTITNELFFLSLNGPVDDVGHTLIIGGTGGGKSILLSLLSAQFMRYPGSRVIYFDKDMSFANFCRRAEGRVYTPALDADLNFMPLSRVQERPAEAIAWLELAISTQGIEVTPDVSKDITDICNTWDNSPATIERFTQRLRGSNPANPAIGALDRILSDPDLKQLFGGEEDDFNINSFSRVTMVEMGKLMELGDHALLPALNFLFDRTDELFNYDPKPTILILDEAWCFLNHKYFRRKIKEWVKTLRKKNVFVIFALQNVGDVDDIEEFLTSCHTKIFLPNPDLKDTTTALADKYRKFGLNDSQMEALAYARRKRDYLIVQNEGISLVDFCVDRFQLEMIARDGR